MKKILTAYTSNSKLFVTPKNTGPDFVKGKNGKHHYYNDRNPAMEMVMKKRKRLRDEIEAFHEEMVLNNLFGC